MADYDVAVTELSSPPPSAVKTTYRPAVRIRNNGIHDALASGILRVYSAGRLIFTTEIYSAVIPPKETREAQAVNYWTPETEGSYLVIADATCPLDQVETNNHLSPTTIIVGPGEAPVPPVVTQHAAQHEEGGTDQISIDGLRGEAYDPQPPKDHVSRHEQGGSDELSVGGLHGQLADAQPTEDHGNEHHTKTFETVSGCTAQIGTHNSSTAPHPGTTNLEYVERKGAENGYAPLDSDSLVPAENLPPITSHGNELHTTSEDYPVLISATDEGAPGSSEAVARADHKHRGSGPIAVNDTLNVGPTPGVDLISFETTANFINNRRMVLDAAVAFKCITGTSPTTLTVDLLMGITGQPLTYMATLIFEPQADQTSYVDCRFCISSKLTSNQASAFGVIDKGSTGQPSIWISPPVNVALGQGFAFTIKLRATADALNPITVTAYQPRLVLNT